jgi:spore coat protein U-like protein
VTLGQGANPGGGSTAAAPARECHSHRAVGPLSAGNLLSYNLYLDPTRLTIWGDGSATTGTVSGTGITGSYTVYGRIPARQNAVVGIYADIVTVTVAF